jgi:hypothetical protein
MSLPPEILQQRYSAIERAYSERRWAEVESLSQALLAELPPNPTDPLQLRLVLLLGHTRLYGMADPPGARLYYESVVEHCQEPTLREIAQQGLEQCGRAGRPGGTVSQPAAPWLGSEHDPSQASAPPPQPGVPAGGGPHATPWLTGDQEEEPAPAAPQSDQQPTPVDGRAGGPFAGAALAADSPAAAQAVPESGARAGANAAEAMAPPQPLGQQPGDFTGVLVPEIVDEPEQILLAQANPRQRQELPLEEVAEPSSLQSTQEPDPGELTAEQLDDLSRGLLRIKVP